MVTLVVAGADERQRHSKSFHTQRNWKIANDASAGTDIGRISLKNVWKWLAPSILADSMTVLGRVAM